MSVRFRVHANKSVTLAGVDYQDFRSILESASIYNLESQTKLRKKEHLSEHDRENLAFYEHELKVLDAIRQGINDAIAATFPPKHPPNKAQRLKAVMEEKREREFLDSLLPV